MVLLGYYQARGQVGYWLPCQRALQGQCQMDPPVETAYIGDARPTVQLQSAY